MWHTASRLPKKSGPRRPPIISNTSPEGSGTGANGDSGDAMLAAEKASLKRAKSIGFVIPSWFMIVSYSVSRSRTMDGPPAVRPQPGPFLGPRRLPYTPPGNSPDGGSERRRQDTLNRPSVPQNDRLFPKTTVCSPTWDQPRFGIVLRRHRQTSRLDRGPIYATGS